MGKFSGKGFQYFLLSIVYNIILLSREKSRLNKIKNQKSKKMFKLSKFEIQLKDYSENNDLDYLGNDRYEDPDGNIIHECEVIEMMEEEEKEWFRSEDESRRSSDQLCSNESRI